MFTTNLAALNDPSFMGPIPVRVCFYVVINCTAPKLRLLPCNENPCRSVQVWRL